MKLIVTVGLPGFGALREAGRRRTAELSMREKAEKNHVHLVGLARASGLRKFQAAAKRPTLCNRIRPAAAQLRSKAGAIDLFIG